MIETIEWNRLGWDIDDISKRRADLHEGIHASSRPLSPEYERVGVCGEVRTSDHTLLPVDIKDRPGGDKSIDHVFTSGYTTDTKTARIPLNLPLEVAKAEKGEYADILILGQYFDEYDRAILLGWEWAEEMLKCPTGYFGKHRILNYYKPKEKLRPIEELAKYQEPFYMWNVRKQRWEIKNARN